MKVLFCTDGSAISFNALKNFSKWFNNFTVDVLSVSDMTHISDSVLINNNKLIEQCSNGVNNILNASKNFLNEQGIKTGIFIKKCGSATDNILNIEANGEYKYIIMGSNGKKGIQKWLGSVSQEVASHSKTSIYISKYKQSNKKVLFAVNPTQGLNTEIKNILSDINLVNSDIDLCAAYEMPDFLFLNGNDDINWISSVEIRQQEEILKKLNSVEKLFINQGYKPKNKFILKGSPSEEILSCIDQNTISLVVMGMRNIKKQFNSSSVSRRVLEYSSSDVLINKCK